MAISAKDVKDLREKTGAGMMDAKKALEETNGDMEKAIDLLREKGLAKAAKKAGRIAAEGLIDMIIAEDHAKGAILEVNSETDFVAKNQEFVDFVHAVCETVIDKEPTTKEDLDAAEFKSEGKSVDIVLKEKIAKIGENMSIRRFVIEKGKIFGYVHGSKIAVLINLESDADPSKLAELGKDLAMQVASMSPKYVCVDDVDPAYVAHEKEILMNQALNENEEDAKAGKKTKPVEIIEKMVAGRLQKELKEVCLLEQAFVKDSELTIAQLIEKISKNIGSPIKVASFQRFEVGEGLEKREEDFQAEVAKQIKG